MSSYVRRKTPGDTEWFVQDRFGMFIHFGLYSAAGRHEWIKSRECMSEENYDRYLKDFNPDLFDAKEWARKAKEAGMKYVILTAKHHDGFCLFDSKYTDYKVTNTPFGRDLIKEYADAFREEGLRVGLYYSLVDWHHPDFTIDKIHPRRNDENAEELNQGREMKKYAQYMRDQVSELMTNYGKIDIVFFDFSYPGKSPDGRWDGKGKEEWESEQLIETVRKLQPGIIINNRSCLEQDLWTPEQRKIEDWVKHEETGELVTWEACHTFSGSWGYFRDEMTWKSPEVLIRILIDAVSRGGNLLMNVGPTARGYIDYRAEESLKVYGNWMKYHDRSIYGCTMAEPEIQEPDGCRLTQSEDGKRLYVHIIEYPYGEHGGEIRMYGMEGKVEYAQFLHDASEIQYSDGYAYNGGVKIVDNLISLKIPPVKPNVVVPVVELFLK